MTLQEKVELLPKLEKAEKMGLPITIKLVSEWIMELRVYTDCPDKLSYEEDFKLLNLKNTFHNPKSNQRSHTITIAKSFSNNALH